MFSFLSAHSIHSLDRSHQCESLNSSINEQVILLSNLDKVELIFLILPLYVDVSCKKPFPPSFIKSSKRIRLKT